MTQYSFFVTCPKHIEGLLAEEISALGGISTRTTVGGVYVSGDLKLAYTLCLWSRLANRVLLILCDEEITSVTDLYDLVQSVDWLTHLTSKSTFWVDFHGENEFIRHTTFGAQKVKDAIVDQIRDKTQNRPTIDKDEPDVRINVYLNRQHIVISLDLSGDSLHRRGYRVGAGAAPIKENLAAAILIRANWLTLLTSQAPLIDPLCGSGTILTEALLMAADIAPGLLRDYFGFLGWQQHDIELWKTIREEALLRKDQGLKKPLPVFMGFDADIKTINRAKNNLQQIGLGNYIQLYACELASWHKPEGLKEAGLIITNPPYGERLSDLSSLPFLYKHLAAKVKAEFPGWHMAVLTGNPELAKAMKLRADKKYSFYNGPIACELVLYSIHVGGEDFSARFDEVQAAKTIEYSSGTRMLINRLEKNYKKLKSWLTRENITCYRLYDADMPEYAAAIDVYDKFVYVQEYAAPKTIDPEKADARFLEILQALPEVLDIKPSQIIVKERKRQKGSLQYQKFSAKGDFYEVQEYDCRFLLNLTDYLDTGLFLDHRPVRRMLRQWTQGKKFLNLFCYTGTATIHAAKAGAVETTSVDLSPTYTRWVKQNLALNGFSDKAHQVIEADCLKWLIDNKIKYDVILLDPPTFSNSKRTPTVFDVQEDHVKFIKLAMHSLKKDGTLIFSTNFRKFKLDEDALMIFDIKNVTAQTFDPDFTRDKKLHYCWLIRYKSDKLSNGFN